MHWMVSFDIENRQDEYAKCLQMIQNIRAREISDISDNEFLKKVKYNYSKNEILFSDFIKGKSVCCYEASPLIQPTDDLKCVFYVDCSNENDIVNIIYYCLINEKLEGKSILCINSDNQQKASANINDLLSDLLSTGIIRDCYVGVGDDYRRINSYKFRMIKRFSPIFRIDESDETVAYWRQSVHSFLLKLYKHVPVGGSGYEYTRNYFLPHMCPKALRSRYPKDIKTDASNNRDSKLMNIFSESFCCRETADKEFTEKRYRIWKSEELFEYVKDMPLLAMYIFCISDYFQKDPKTDSMEQIKQEIFNARDMADGLLQILENVYHSEKRRGYFCFRVHNNSEGRSKPYLKEQYKSYMKQRESKQPVNYLEIKVVDYSHCTIPNKFYYNFVKRMESAGEADRKTYQKIQNQAEQIQVSSFFHTSDFWHAYNSISENVVHHYGLQIFESLVSCYDGYFRVRSQEKYHLQSETEAYSSIHDVESAFQIAGIPGTQYDIILPFRTQKVMQNISLNVNINYTNYLLKKFTVRRTIDFTTDYCTEVYEKVQQTDVGKAMTFQEKKEKTIQELAIRLKESLDYSIDENLIIHISSEKIALTMVEMFCKAVMLYIAQKSPKGCYIMITDCTQSHFIEITRMIALFYDKQGFSSLMKDTQIFLSGKKEGEEFLISGTNLGEAIGSTEKLAFARCIHPDCLKILKKMLKNHKMGRSAPNEVVSIVPFDMIKYDSMKQTLFEESLQNVLNQDVQSDKFGCKLENLHVRIGSKIHIRTFYEAELLFHNNYYTSRFAYWLLNELINNNELDMNKPFILVGYENYSEMLLSELCNMFSQIEIETDYLIYEQKSIGKFRGRGPLWQYKNHQFIIIVPINSTMTTHIKASGFLEKTIKESLQEKENKDFVEYHLSKVFNYGIILISDGDKNQYWEKSSQEENTIVSKIDRGKMKFYTEVISEWAHPLECKACFPEREYTKEVPLVETNKESVVPMHAISIKKNAVDKSAYKISDQEMGKLKELSKFLVYDHVERNGNHFNYYFSTEKLWDFPEIRENVQKWLREQRKLFPKEECKVYDIIVAPLHYSNTAFVEEVNNWLFSNAALVLHFDVDKEFRMNVKTKYSSIQQLYDNLSLDDETSIINFHYVDDTIISGHTYNRMRSLIKSLVNRREDSRINIRIFKSIVLLVNRMSNSSIKDYIEDTRYFMSYFNLNISSMRVNSDACILCKKYEEWNKLAEQASLNEVYGYWKHKSNKLKCKPIERLGLKKKQESGIRQRRAKQYMLASHRAKALLDVLCCSANHEEIKLEIVEQLFPNEVNREFEELIAVLKILGRPFMTFRKEEKEAVFDLMLTMLDALLQKTEPSGEGKLFRILRELYHSKENRTKIIMMLLNRLAELESNYIIRKHSMNLILAYCIDNNNIAGEEDRSKFINNYLNRVKQLVGQSKDFAKGLYLEYLLLYGEEYQSDYTDKEIISLEGKDPFVTFQRNVYLENTKLADYGIEYLADCFANAVDYSEEKLKNALNENYYFDNFIQYLAFHKFVKIGKSDETGKISKSGKITDFFSEVNVSKLEGMVRFQLLYQDIFKEWKISGMDLEESQESEKDLKNKFAEMLEYLKAASGARDGEIIVPYKNQYEWPEKYIALGLARSSEIRRLENKEQYLLEFMKTHTSFEGDTYKICKRENQQKWILLKFHNGISTRRDAIPIIYMLFSFDIHENGEILHALKNILIFRNKIWKILNLSSSTLLQNWTDSLFYKQQMLKSRAVGHAEMDSLVEQFTILTGLICRETYMQKEVEEQNIYKKYFELLVNSLIGFMNSQVLGDKGKDYMSSSDLTFMKFWEGERETVKAVETVWKLEIKILREEELQTKKIRKGTEQKDKTPALDVLRTLFLAIFQNARKHGSHHEKKCIISIYTEDDYLCISNHVDEKKREGIEGEISQEAYRSGEGISQAVIFDICNSWYKDIKYEELFTLKKEEIDSKGWSYVVKLPIIERMDAK